MSSSTTTSKPAARPGRIAGSGGGMLPDFLCSSCHKAAPLAGRRLKRVGSLNRVGGIKRWVCKGCAG